MIIVKIRSGTTLDGTFPGEFVCLFRSTVFVGYDDDHHHNCGQCELML